MLPEKRLAAVEHLEELRYRIIVSLAALVVAFVGMYLIQDRLIDALAHPLVELTRSR